MKINKVPCAIRPNPVLQTPPISSGPLTEIVAVLNNGNPSSQGKWTRQLRTHFSPPSHLVDFETFGLGKRAKDDGRIPPGFSNKRQQIVMENDFQSQILAEAVQQPCQKQ